MTTPISGPRFRLSATSTPLRPAGSPPPPASTGPPASSPFGRRMAASPLARPQALNRRSDEEKEADAAEAAAASPGWKGGPLLPSSSPSSSLRPRGVSTGGSSVLAPLQSAQGTGFEISHEIDSLRMELQEIRMSNSALQQTNQELHEALAQVTERSKLLSSEHARFLDEFREKSQRSKQKLINDRAALKLNLGATNTRLEDLEKLNSGIEAEKMRVLRKFEELTEEHDQLAVNYANLQKEKQIWIQKEEEYLEIQSIQARNLEELNRTVLQIQEEREGWHQRYEESQAQLAQSQQHAASLELTVQTQDTGIQQLNANLLTAQEEIMNLTQTLATHLEQIANISKQNKELHATLVNFTRTDDKEFVSSMLPNLSALDDLTLSTHRIEVVHPVPTEPTDPNLNPSFHGPVPAAIHSPAFLSNRSKPVHPLSSNVAYNFLHTTSGLSTLHLPATYITAKLSSYILWILEHKQILENMMQRKEKLRKELEEQIVVANVEAQVNDPSATLRPDALNSPPRHGSPISPHRSRASSPAPVGASGSFSPSRSGPLASVPLPSSALPPPTLLLPSLLQHTLHDLHELTHLTQHDALQFSNFEKEKVQILTQCSSHGFSKYNTKRVKTAWNIWTAALTHKIHRRQALDRILQRTYFREIGRSFSRLRASVLVRHGLAKIQEKSNEMKSKIVTALVRKTNEASAHAQQLVFREWRGMARRNAKAKHHLVQSLVTAVDARILKLWTTWKANVLKLRHMAAVYDAHDATEQLQTNFRSGLLDKMTKIVDRRARFTSIQRQRTVFLAWRTCARNRRARKRQILDRLVHICCGEGRLGKAWHMWKEFNQTTQIQSLQQELSHTRTTLTTRYEVQREKCVVGYTLLRERYHNFKLYHWWRLAYVDTQWLKREDQWRRALTGQKQLQIRHLIKMHRNYNYLPVFHAWRKLTRDSKQGKIRSAVKIFKRLITIQLHHGFRRWARFNDESRVEELQYKLTDVRSELAGHKKKFIHSLVMKWRRHHLANAFNQLYDQVQARKSRKREILDRTVRRLEQTHVWGAFRQWQHFCEQQAVGSLKQKLVEQKGKFSSLLVQRWRLSTLVPAFAQWRSRVADKKERRKDILHRTFKKLMNSSLWRAMRLWRRFTEQSSVGELKMQLAQRINQQKRLRATELIKKWRVAALVPAFTQWTNVILLRKRRKRDILDRTCRRLQHVTLWRAFHTWIKYSEKVAVASIQAQMGQSKSQAAEQRKKMAQHLLAKWRTNREKARFIAWRNYTVHARAHKRALLDRTLKRLSSGYLGRAWAGWVKFVEASRLSDMQQLLNDNKAKTVQQAVAKWRHRIVTTPFINWRNYTRKRKVHKQSVLDRMVRRITSNGVYRAFRTWTDYVEQTKVAYMRQKFLTQKGELKDQLFEQKQKRIHALIQRWRGASLTSRFSQWRIYARTSRAKKKVRLDQILRRMVASTLWKGWREWKAYVELHRAHRQLQASEGAMVQFKHQTMVDAQNARQRHILTKTLDRMANLLLFAGWRSWIEYTQASRAFDITLQKRKLEAQTLALQRKQAELIRSHTQANLERKQQIVDKTLRRIAYANVYKALRVWKKETENRAVWDMRNALKAKENHLKLRLIHDRIANHRKNTLKPLMVRWSKYAKARRARKAELLGKMVKRMMNLMVWQSMRHWKNVAHGMAIEQMRTNLEGKLAHQKKQRLEHLIRTWRHRSLAPSFVGWRAYARANNKRKHLLAKVFARLTHIQTFNAFRQWREWRDAHVKAEEHRTRQLVVIDRTLKRMCSGLVGRAFHTWTTYTELHKQAQINTSLLALRTSAVMSKFKTLNRTQVKTNFIEWRRYVRTARKERGMIQEMSHFRKLDVLDRTYRRISATGMWKAFQHWRTYILRTRLIVNDKLGEYSEAILALRKQSEIDSLKLHEYLTENQKLKSNILSIKHKQQTMSLMSEKQRENRAILFAYNTILAKTFRAFYQRVHMLKRRKLFLHKTCQHVKENAALRTLQHWKKQVMLHRSAMMAHALDTAKKQLDQCLGKVWSLETQLSQRSAEAESVAQESQQLLLNAQAQEMNHQLEKQMPSEREIALAQEVDTLAAKLELLLKEVKERGNHIQFLSAENQRLSGLAKSTGGVSTSGASGPISVGFPTPHAAGAASAIHNHTLNLSSSFARSRGPTAPNTTLVDTSAIHPTNTTANNTTLRGTQFFP